MRTGGTRSGCAQSWTKGGQRASGSVSAAYARSLQQDSARTRREAAEDRDAAAVATAGQRAPRGSAAGIARSLQQRPLRRRRTRADDMLAGDGPPRYNAQRAKSMTTPESDERAARQPGRLLAVRARLFP